MSLMDLMNASGEALKVAEPKMPPEGIARLRLRGHKIDEGKDTVMLTLQVLGYTQGGHDFDGDPEHYRPVFVNYRESDFPRLIRLLDQMGYTSEMKNRGITPDLFLKESRGFSQFSAAIVHKENPNNKESPFVNANGLTVDKSGSI